ncbi:hypothetical protein HanRHA438_Chr14g0636591 [Helianthus annuus]|nr:hypothetical protein HanIR_Chr14g0678201 [Helianthus annuus]KAJ0852304.1 hypothetical protein HanRHA438_Chr14g0636591 [Helianthus annuus]
MIRHIHSYDTATLSFHPFTQHCTSFQFFTTIFHSFLAQSNTVMSHDFKVNNQTVASIPTAVSPSFAT